jgi:hypothetical protein
MSYYIRNGNTFRVTSENSLDIHNQLPVGNYVVKMDKNENFFLEEVDSFTLPTKMYGLTTKHTLRVLNTYQDRTQSTGIMLNGEKGSGKTLLAKSISIEAAKTGIPTIIINAPWRGDEFNTFIQNINQECVILFDEFEKIYDQDDQDEILTLLDGVYPSKKLFIVTCNDGHRINSHMKNRPGRIYYLLDFVGLEQEFIMEYCQDNLKPEYQEYGQTITNISILFGAFNFDMLKAMVEEINRYGETPQEALKMLNVKMEYDKGSKYNTELVVDGLKVISHDYSEGYAGNPLSTSGIGIDYDMDPDNEDLDYETITFNTNDLTKVDSEEGIFVFTKGTAVFTLTKTKTKPFDYFAF